MNLRKLKIKDWHFIGLFALLTIFIHTWGMLDSKNNSYLNAYDCLSELNDEVFADSVSSRLCFVLFYAGDSKLCDRVLADLNEVAEKNNSAISFFKMDVDKYPECCESFNIYGIPSVVIYNKGKEVNRIMGVVPKRNYDVIYNRFANLQDNSDDSQIDNYQAWLGNNANE